MKQLTSFLRKKNYITKENFFTAEKTTASFKQNLGSITGKGGDEVDKDVPPPPQSLRI
jgi:hypothetical protein